MARRVSALVVMVALVALLVLLVWDVYRHHELVRESDEPAVVHLDGSAGRAVVKFAPAIS